MTKFNPNTYKDTYEYYAKYRPEVAKEVIDIIITHFNLEPSDRVLDLGCGTGKVALALDNKCAEVVGLDIDPEMLSWAQKATKDSRTKNTWIKSSDEELIMLKDDLGIFKVATLCRSFHWMNQEQLLNDLDDLIDDNGGVAIFSDKGFWSGKEEWQQTIKRITQKYLGDKKSNGEERFKNPERLWTEIVEQSPFKFVKNLEIPIIRNWDIDSIIGCVFSYSSSAPYLFNDQIDKFKEELKNSLLSINPNGEFQENSVWTIVLASRNKD